MQAELCMRLRTVAWRHWIESLAEKTATVCLLYPYYCETHLIPLQVPRKGYGKDGQADTVSILQRGREDRYWGLADVRVRSVLFRELRKWFVVCRQKPLEE